MATIFVYRDLDHSSSWPVVGLHPLHLNQEGLITASPSRVWWKQSFVTPGDKQEKGQAASTSFSWDTGSMKGQPPYKSSISLRPPCWRDHVLTLQPRVSTELSRPVTGAKMSDPWVKLFCIHQPGTKNHRRWCCREQSISQVLPKFGTQWICETWLSLKSLSLGVIPYTTLEKGDGYPHKCHKSHQEHSVCHTLCWALTFIIPF